MRSYFATLLFFSISVMPEGPLDTDMDESEKKFRTEHNPDTSLLWFQKRVEPKRKDEVLENRYEVPDAKEEAEFNKNGI